MSSSGGAQERQDLDFNIVDILHEGYDLDTFPCRSEVRMSNEPHFLNTDDLPEDFTDMVDIDKVDENAVYWSIRLEEFEGAFGSVRSGAKTIKHGEKYKHRHEFVAQGLSLLETDQKLSLIQSLNDDDDNRTPDFIFKRGEDEFHVLELATTRMERPENLFQIYRNKTFAYQGALENRSLGKCITFSVIIVARDVILSSIPLPDILVKELIARMRLSLCLESKAEMISLDMEGDERSGFKKRISKSIEEVIKSINYRTISDHPLNINREYVNSCLREADDIKVLETLLEEITTTEKEIEDIKKQNVEEKIQEYIKKFDLGNRRYDQKPITFFPFFVIPENEPSSDIPKESIFPCKSLPATSKLWSVAMDDYENNPQKMEEDPTTLINEAISEDREEIRKLEYERHLKRRKYHRVDLRGVLDESDLESLAEQGLWAKKHKGDEFMIARRIHQQSGFKWSTPTQDIENFLNTLEDLEDAKIEEDPTIPLIQKANELTGNSQHGTNFLKDWRKTKLFQAMDIISDIAYEVAISNKQHCKSKEMILKKLRRFKLYLLICPTKSTEHTFVSLYAPIPYQIMHEGVFGRTHQVYGGVLTDFFSIKQGKLENQSSMPSSLLALASFWSWFFKLQDASPQSFKDNPEAYYMLKFSLLVRLEDKAQTEETITMTRYMYMEVFKSFFSVAPSHPFKMLEKLSTYPRSRLNLFCLKKIILNFGNMYNDPPIRTVNQAPVALEDGEDSVPNDHWSKLLNWISGNPVPTASRAINLVYLGYLKNKMESPEGNTDFQLVEKTCEEEFKLNLLDPMGYLGEKQGRPSPKEFNKNSIIHGCDVMIKRLEQQMGKDWKLIINHDILEALTSRMTIELATLKASANIDHSKTDKEASLSDPIGAGRIKVIEAVVAHLEELGVNPIIKLESLLTKIENSSKGVICDLFKKQQHGGLREIYVLTIESRVIQLYIETLSRVLCSYFEEETLTHPRNKLRKLDQHRAMTARISAREDSTYVDFCCSSDKTRWNQNFVMPAMVIPLIKLLPEAYHASVSRCLNLWTHKLIKLPQRVLTLLLNSTEMTSETYAKLLDEFWNPQTNSIFDKPISSFMRLTSGMMQGILHYTSSLLHLSFLNSMNVMVPMVMKKSFPNHSFLMTQVCSSDDSATILTIFSPPGEKSITDETLLASRRTSHVLETLNNMAPYYCMKNSVKTTTSVVDYVEFNSEFLFRNTISIPIIKYAIACLNITESESFLERFHTMYNLISDLFASGFPAYNTHLCQIAQAYNHYKTMGLTINPVFPFWAREILSLPDPVLGFFLIDVDLCPGTLGYSYSYWKCATNSLVLKRTLGSLFNDVTEVIDSGGIVQSLIIKHGDVKRWRNLVENVSSNVDINESIETNPELLFTSPQTLHELRVSLAIKSTMPSVGRSMRRGNPYLQSLAMSVYAINTHCFSKTTVTQDVTGKVQKSYAKVSLLTELRRRLIDQQNAEPLTREMLEMSFPALDRFEEADRIITSLRSYTLVRCSSFRHRRTEVFVQPFSSFVPLSLQQTLLCLWFGHKVRTSVRIFNRCVNVYKAKLPWIQDNIRSTLERSPFSTYQELANFISSHNIKSRTFVRVGPGISSKRLTGQLHQLIKKGQKDGYVLKSGKKVRERHGSAEMISKLSLALTLPGARTRYEEAFRILRREAPIYDDINSIQRMSKRDANLAYLQGFAKNDFTIDEITTSIQQTGSGLLYAYTSIQERVETPRGIIWRGPGQCYVSCEQCLLMITMRDHYAEKIEVSSWNRFRGHVSTLSTIMKELKLIATEERGMRVGRLVARYDGLHWLPVDAIGTPILENPDLSIRLRDVSEIKLEVGFQSISLVQTTPRGRAAVIRFKTYPGDILLNPSPPIGGGITDCWLNQRPLSSDRGVAMMIGSSAPRQISDESKRWMLDTFLARLSQKGLSRGPGHLSPWVPTIGAPVLPAPVAASEEMIIKIQEEMRRESGLVFGMKLEEIGKTLEGVSLDPIYDQPEVQEQQQLQWGLVFHNLMEMEMEENIDITSRGVKAFKYLHPFWDKTIDDIEADYPGLWNLAFRGIAHPGYEELSRAVMNLAGVREQVAAPTLRERAKLQIVSVLSELGTEAIEPTPSTSAAVRDDESPSWAEEAERTEDEDDEEGLYFNY